MHFIFQFVPLKAWLYREGFARFSNTRYSLSTIEDKCILLHNHASTWCKDSHFTQVSTQCFFADMHLTNVAIQKTAPDYDPESVRRSQNHFCVVVSETCSNSSLLFVPPKVRKWTVQQLRRYLTAKHGRERVGRLFEDIDNIFVCSLQSVQKVIINDKHCFELYGYDILLDENLKP